jgi:preprotein translocase subunit SecD
MAIHILFSREVNEGMPPLPRAYRHARFVADQDPPPMMGFPMRLPSTVIAGLATVLLCVGVAAAAPLALAVASAKLVRDSTSGQVALSLELTPDGKQAFAAFTTANVGKIVDLSIDGAVVMSPRLMEPIVGGEIMVSGAFAPGELERIAQKIASGKATVAVDAKAK